MKFKQYIIYYFVTQFQVHCLPYHQKAAGILRSTAANTDWITLGDKIMSSSVGDVHSQGANLRFTRSVMRLLV